MAKKDSRQDVIFIERIEEGPPPEEGLPPWMATFADMVTLLLCFFVLLLSFTNQDISNFQMMMGAMADAFGVQTRDSSAKDMPYADMSKQHVTVIERESSIKQLASSLEKFVAEEQMNKDASVSYDSSGVLLRVSNVAMFQAGQFELAPEAVPVLVEVITVLNEQPFNLMVMGHTDGEELNANLLDTNWELSATRAASCLRFILQHSSTSPERLKAVGYAGSRPLVPSTTQENIAKNRRVEFYFMAPGDPDW